MIDIENAKKVFNEYVKNFNPEDGRIKLKIEHILRVANYSKQIATNLKLNELKERCDIIDNLSDVLVPKQKELLKWTEGKKVEEYEKNRRYIKSFLKNYDAMDLIYKKRIGN